MLTEELKKITPQEWEEILKDVLIFWIPWADGKDWKNGEDWKNWIQGIQGERWEKGEKGERWDIGEKGDRWDRWDVGIQWTQGIQWQRWDKWDTWEDGEDGIDWLDAVWEIMFSIDGKEWNDSCIKWTQYIRFNINNKYTTIDMTKIL